MIFAEKTIKKYPRIVKLCEFAPSERALFTQRRKEAYEALHPETKHGGNQGDGGKFSPSRQVGDTADRFTADTAARTGQSERSTNDDPASARLLHCAGQMAQIRSIHKANKPMPHLCRFRHRGHRVLENL